MNASLGGREPLVLEHWTHYPPLPPGLQMFFGSVMTVVFFLSVFGNISVLVLFGKHKSLRTPTNSFVINMAVADVSMTLQSTPMVVFFSFRGKWTADYIVCQYAGFNAALTGFVSILSLSAVAYDRSIVISKPYPARLRTTRYKTYVAILFIWLLAGLGAALPFFGLGSYVLEGSMTSCTFDHFTRTTTNIAYNILIQVVYFVIPITIIIVSYSRIFLTVRRHERTFVKLRRSFDEEGLCRMRRGKNAENNEVKTARAGIIIVALFCFSWLPYSVISAWCMLGNTAAITPVVSSLPGILAKTGTLINPIVYALLQKNFKERFWAVYRGPRRQGISSTPSGGHLHEMTVVAPATNEES